MDNPLLKTKASKTIMEPNESAAVASVELSVLEPLIAEALELLISTDDNGLFYEEVRAVELIHR